MISLIIKSYLALLLPIGASAFFIFIAGLYFIFRKPVTKSQPLASVERDVMETPVDLSAIAGDDHLTTQLDLARAYIETGKTQSAKGILEWVVEQGSSEQQQEAKRLLISISG